MSKLRGFFSNRKKTAATGAVMLGLLGTSVGAGTIILAPAAPPGAGTANIWVDSNGGTCVDNASLTAYVDADACGTLDAANDTCDNGDTVIVKASSYVSQSITGSNGRSAQCPMTEADGETVSIAGGSSTGDYVKLDGFTFTVLWLVATGADNNTVTNALFDGAYLDFEDGTDNVYSDSEQRNCTAGAMPTFDGDCTTRLRGTNTIIDGVDFHDLWASDTQPPGINFYHMEAIFVRGCTDCVLRNSKFRNIDSTANVFVQDCCGLGNTNGLIVENNWFGPHLASTNPVGGPSSTELCFTCEPVHIAFNVTSGGTEAGYGFPDFIFRFNSTYSYCDTSLSTTYLTTPGRCGGALYCDNAQGACGTTASNALVYGNLLGHLSISGSGNPASCHARTTYTYNVFYPHNSFNGTGGPCPGTGNVLHTSSIFPYTTQPVGAAMSSTAPNYAITGAAWSGDEIVPSSLCDDVPTDINGNSRNDGGSCDAGAVER
jgi:hypothetical protein